jgi:hypothetical protein
MQAGVYGIRCLVTGEIYVGSGINWENRTRRHLVYLRAGKSIHKKLQQCWDKYGEANFDIVLFRICRTHVKMWETEDRFIKKFKDKLLNSHPSAIANYYKHGMTGTRTFKSWESMLQRCTNKNSPDYHRYGGKGVVVCRRWKNSFERFIDDMGERPEGTSLDRFPDKHGNYEPTNCRWATAGQQQRNLRNNLYIAHNGVKKLLIDWADEKGMPRDLLRRRFHAGMIGDELFAPSYSRYAGDGKLLKRRKVKSRAPKYTFAGKSLTLVEWAEELGLTRSTIRQRVLKYNMPLEKALFAGPLKKGKAGPRIGYKLFTAFGKTQSMTAWALEYKLPLSTLKNRINRAKMPIEKALRA